MRVAVTGAGGFTGRYILDAAARRGIETVALQSDITDALALAAEVAVLSPTHVLHLAGISHVGHSDLEAVYRVNLLGTIHLLQALCELPAPPLQVVLASSATVYGTGARSPIREDEATLPASHYAISKLAMEHAARICTNRLPIVVARAFNYTGPGQSQEFVIPKLVEHFRRRAECVKLGLLDVEREFNDVRFVSEAYFGLLLHGQTGETYNLCTGRPLTLQHVITTLERLTGHRMNIESEASLLRPNEIRTLYGDPSKLRRTVGTLPDYGIEDTLRWMLESAAA